MKKHAGILLFLILASQLLLVPMQAAPAWADTRVTITVAAGGVACGAYFFLRLAFRTLVTIPQDPLDTGALLNHGPDGWQIQFPTVDLSRSDNNITAFPPTPEGTLQMDILKVRF
jgi:hypothetical protein